MPWRLWLCLAVLWCGDGGTRAIQAQSDSSQHRITHLSFYGIAEADAKSVRLDLPPRSIVFEPMACATSGNENDDGGGGSDGKNDHDDDHLSESRSGGAGSSPREFIMRGVEYDTMSQMMTEFGISQSTTPSIPKRSVELPLSVSVRFTAPNANADTAAYHLRHLATLARVLHGFDRSIRSDEMVLGKAPPLNVSFLQVDQRRPFRRIKATFRSANTFSSPSSAAVLQLKAVPDYCRAMLSDVDCFANATRSTMPHTLHEIDECIDTLLVNLFEYFRHFDLPNVRVRIRSAMNRCVRGLLANMLGKRVECRPRVEQETGDGSVVVGTPTYFSFQTEFPGEELRRLLADERTAPSRSPQAVLLNGNLWAFTGALMAVGVFH